MIIPSNALFCLNVNTTLNKWKATVKWKITENKKEFSLTYLEPRIEISVFTDISVLQFYGYIGNIGEISWIFFHKYQ